MPDNIAELIDSLTREEQEAVREFIESLRARRETSASRFQAAVDDFIEKHPDLLRRLAQ